MNRVLNFLFKLLEWFRVDFSKSLILISLGYGVTLLSGFDLSASIKESSITLTNDTGLITDIFGGILVLFSISLGVSRIITSSKSPSIMFYLYGLEHMGNEAPVEKMAKFDRLHALKNEYNALELLNDKEKVIEEYSHYKWSVRNRIEHKDVANIYLCGLTNIPMLFLYGTLFRNAHTKYDIRLIESFRFKEKGWKELNQYNDNSNEIEFILDGSNNEPINSEIQRLITSSYNEVGIGLSFTQNINRDAVPKHLQNETLFLESTLGVDYEIVSSYEAQKELIQKLIKIFSQFSDKGKDKIHLFISAQSTFLINLGIHYQDNMHGTIVIYNYNNNDNIYEWSIEFNQGRIID